MPAIAVGGDDGNAVLSATGAGNGCGSQLTTKTDVCSGNVFIGGSGVVRAGDTVKSHNKSGCSPEAPGLSTHSSTVFINSKGAGRVGDNYAGDGSNIIQAGQSTVFAG